MRADEKKNLAFNFYYQRSRAEDIEKIIKKQNRAIQKTIYSHELSRPTGNIAQLVGRIFLCSISDVISPVRHELIIIPETFLQAHGCATTIVENWRRLQRNERASSMLLDFFIPLSLSARIVHPQSTHITWPCITQIYCWNAAHRFLRVHSYA